MTHNEDHIRRISVLMELRPALDGFYGIPQETRLLFAALSGLEDLELKGLLQMSKRRTKGGVAAGIHVTEAERVHRLSQTVISLRGASAIDWKQGAAEAVRNWLHGVSLRLRALGMGSLSLRRFQTRYFADFIWRQLFASSVPPRERAQLLQHDHLICSSPWYWMHQAGIERSWLLRRADYPRVDTRGTDVMIAQTPYPGRVSRGTVLVVHYHDAIPVLMPHTISDRAFHEASHYHALAANVRAGAWFACVSDATRQDLISLFPEAEPRAVTIHNMIPSHYFPYDPHPERIPGIVRRHIYGEYYGKNAAKKNAKSSGIPPRPYQLSRTFSGEAEKAQFYQQAFAPDQRYLLMVSTIEPRKNHLRLVDAWQAFRDQYGQDLKLVLVGHIGWDAQAVLDACMPGIEQGALFLLHSVPAEALRLLYRHATVTVCPSVGEGFDFSGVEAMRCGGVVAASDIPVHREVYGNAVDYFDPYDTRSVVESLHRLLLADSAEERRAGLAVAGQEQSARYLPERILPQWRDFLHRVAGVSNARDPAR